MRHERVSAAAGLILALALPILVSAHEITNVDVDCDGQAIHISGSMFGQEGGVTVTVTGPASYSQSFFADQDADWTVTLPLGANGAYLIDWPNSGEFGAVSFDVDCAGGEVLPTATATDEPAGGVLPTAGTTDTPEGGVLAAEGTAGAAATLPPTDTLAAPAEQTSDLGLIAALFGLAAVAIWAGLTAIDRRSPRTGRVRSR